LIEKFSSGFDERRGEELVFPLLMMVRVAVLGCEALGEKIAGTFALWNHGEKVFDVDLRQLDSLHQRLHHDEDQLFRDGLTLTPTFPVSPISLVLSRRRRRRMPLGTNPLFEPIGRDGERR
jgi:hypothetical protein